MVVMKPRVIVLRAAGSNCDVETKYAFDCAGADAELVHINRLKEKSVRLSDYQILAIPGGFTYGDDISAGKVLANELRYGLADQLTEFYQKDKLILGICNGFQVLVKAGLLPDVDFDKAQSVTLTFNDSGKFEDRWVHLRVADTKCVFTRHMPERVYFPVAHAEGKFVVHDSSVLEMLKRNQQIVFQYDNPFGRVEYPMNPNGSVDHIAGICDPQGRILGLMPHPERHVDPTQHPQWTRLGAAETGEGLPLFRNAVRYFTE